VGEGRWYSIVNIIRSKQRKCIYDAGDNGFYQNNGQLSSDNYTLDDMGDINTDEVNNFNIWSYTNHIHDNINFNFYLLVTGSCGRTCSTCHNYQFHDCKVYIWRSHCSHGYFRRIAVSIAQLFLKRYTFDIPSVCDELETLVQYAMTKTQRRQYRDEVWFKY